MARQKETPKLIIRVVYEPAPDAEARLARAIYVLLNQHNKDAKTAAQKEKTDGNRE